MEMPVLPEPGQEPPYPPAVQDPADSRRPGPTLMVIAGGCAFTPARATLFSVPARGGRPDVIGAAARHP
jgi:hypothetical protein